MSLNATVSYGVTVSRDGSTLSKVTYSLTFQIFLIHIVYVW